MDRARKDISRSWNEEGVGNDVKAPSQARKE